MATGKLYPPKIAGTLPSFYTSSLGTTNIVVPFSMNKIVSAAEVSKFSLRLKTVNTDILYGVIESNNWNPKELNELSVIFELPANLVKKLSLGSFYKIQLAYVDNAGIVGYYSTIGIIKYTSRPIVEISDLLDSVTNFNKTEYIGSYRNDLDPSEKVYEYCFNFYDRMNNLLESSGWKLHNTYEDTSLISSIDRYTLNYALVPNITYKIQYGIRTNNGLTIYSTKYLIMEAESVNPEINAAFIADMDYNNACVNLRLLGEKDSNTGAEYAISGSFQLSRASSLNNYSSWLPISVFRLTGDLPSVFLFKDYAVEQGATYIYSLQQFNDFGIYSNRLLTDKITVQFEDAFLYDGERQLRIRYNPKITSFKTVVQDSKKNTIGSKYPFIFRNGAVEYKEFPISGLISYMIDPDEFFVSKKNDLHLDNFKETTDIIDENISAERLFKLEVMNWLNNGGIKLFKSPQEGNYIVRLMNVSLSPIDTVSRMLHNFSCTASEIADYTPENLQLYNLMNVDEIITYQMRWATVSLLDLYKQDRNNFWTFQNGMYYSKDLLDGYEGHSIKITDAALGTILKFTDNLNETHEVEVMVGVTGSYEIQLDSPIKNLQIVSRTNSQPSGNITFSIMSANTNNFDTIKKMESRDILLDQTFGPNENILSYYSNIRRNLSRIYYARYSKLEVQDVYAGLLGEENLAAETSELDKYYFTGEIENLMSSLEDGKNSPIYIYPLALINENKEIIYNYYYYYSGRLYAYPFSVAEDRVKIMSHILNYYTIYKDKEKYYCLVGDQFEEITNNSLLYDEILKTNPYVNLNAYTLYKRYYNDGSVKYFRYYNNNLQQIDGDETKLNLIEYFKLNEKLDADGNQIYDLITSFDVSKKQNIYIEELDYVPDKIKIGAGVCAELGYQVRYFTYNIEEYCAQEKENYLAAYKDYVLALFNLIEVKDKSVINNTNYKNYCIIQDERIITLTSSMLDTYVSVNNTTPIYTLNVPSQQLSYLEVEALYMDMIEKDNIFIDKINELLAKRENGEKL